MHATKETCIIAFGSMLLALLLTLLMRRRQGTSALSIKKMVNPWHVIAAVATAVIVSTLFYSSFLTNPGGILDSVRSYTAYFQRAGQNQWHIHPWYYYLDILTWMEGFEELTWNEDVIVVLAVVGFIVAVTKKGISSVNFNLLRFIAFYTLIMTVFYSAIPYKTPWCLLGFLHGMILLAAVGAAFFVKIFPTYWLNKVFVGFLFFAGGASLICQAYMGSYHYYANPSNPYVYAHPVTDVVTIARRVEEIDQVHPSGLKMHIQVICPEHDHWPLPWYLRRFEKGTIDWWDKVADDVPAAPVIIASPSVETALMRKLYELPPPGKKNLYVPLFDSYMELRPQVELRGYVTKELWDSYQQFQVQSILLQTTDQK